MKSRLETYMNPGGHILASMLLAIVLTAAAGAQTAPAISSTEARKAIEAGYSEWAKARTALDINAIEKILAPDFYYQLPDRKLTRQEFIDRVHSAQTARFDVSVLTVEPRGNAWSVLISAKLEVKTNDKDGKTSKGYTIVVARDGWRKLNDNLWTLLSSEPLGRQQWQEHPPIANWDAINGTVIALSPQLMANSAKRQDTCSGAPSGIERATPHEVDR